MPCNGFTNAHGRPLMLTTSPIFRAGLGPQLSAEWRRMTSSLNLQSPSFVLPQLGQEVFPPEEIIVHASHLIVSMDAESTRVKLLNASFTTPRYNCEAVGLTSTGKTILRCCQYFCLEICCLTAESYTRLAMGE